jgi:hypothetical protein
MPNAWVTHVKNFAANNNVSYSCAISMQNVNKVIKNKNNFLYYYIIYNYNIIMSISSTGLYGSATIVNSDLFQDVSDLK